jgi:uncharacterized membrane protein YbhN (UPF0104 family)
MFFSLFLPTLVGGDGVKTFYISPDWRSVPAALYTLIADRTIGLAAMVLFILPGLPAVAGVWPPWIVIGLPVSVITVYVILFALPRLSTGIILMNRRLRDVPRERLFVYWEKWRVTGRAWLLSLGIHTCLVIAHILMAVAIGLNIPGPAWAVIYPLTAIAGFLPISLSGVGPREAAYVYLTGLFGVARETALAFAMMWLTIVVLNGLVGGIIYVVGGEVRVKNAVG